MYIYLHLRVILRVVVKTIQSMEPMGKNRGGGLSHLPRQGQTAAVSAPKTCTEGHIVGFLAV